MNHIQITLLVFLNTLFSKKKQRIEPTNTSVYQKPDISFSSVPYRSIIVRTNKHCDDTVPTYTVLLLQLK